MGALIRAKDWSATPLGPVERWPQSLRSAVSILLPSRAQICLFWGPELVAIYNDAYRPTLGIKHPWALGRPAREVWSEIWHGVLGPLFEGVLGTGESFGASAHPFFLERRGYSEETYFDVSYDPVRDESGGVGGVFCIVSEMSGRVIGERRLRLLRDLGRAASGARSVHEVFERAAAVFEANPNDVPFAALFDADGHARAGCRCDRRDGWPLESVRVAGERVLFGEELRGFGPLSGGAWPEPSRAAVVLPIGLPGQPPDGFLAAGASPRLELDDAYRDFLRLVASSVAAAAAAARALEEQRAQAEALAELDRAKTAFFSNVSHEFRTPLTLMLAPLEELVAAEKSGLSQRERHDLETAQRNGLRLQRLVNTLLDFSRLEAGRAQAHYEPTDLAKLTAELASNFGSACEKAGLRLLVDTPSLRAPVYVDRAMWEKVVLNLLSNAFKFTFEGEIEVTLLEAEGGAELSVRDTGVGVPADHLPRLFERFHRVEGARARTHEGSGIGLAFVQELVRLHGGEIRVDSEPGRGSRFRVRLPFGSAHLPQDRVAAPGASLARPGGAAAYVAEALGWLRGSSSPPAVEARAPRGAERLLVVDDNADMRDYLERVLLERWQVATASNGREALARLRQEAFDLVISDVMMPELDGFGLLREIKSHPATAEVPVMLLSARAGEEARVDGVAAGADDYVVKPFTAQQLLAQVAAQLKLRAARGENAAERQRLLAREHAAKLEAELQREHLLSLVMQVPNPILILRGPEHTIDLVNPPLLRLWGRTREEVAGRPLFEVRPERRDPFQPILAAVLATGMPYQGKASLAGDRDGGGTAGAAHFNFYYTPLRGISGATEGILVTAFDVTDEVTEREQMAALRSEAERANRSKDEFLAMLGHELRNPLSPIVTAIHLMRLRGVQSPELGMLERQTAQLTRLVDDLLDVSRITSGKIELRRRSFELVDAVLRAMETVSPVLEMRAHRVDMQGVPRTGLAVHADLQRLGQAIANLLSNAAKYSEPGSPITLRAGRDGGRVRLSVEDAGVGIAPEMQQRVFELFVQQPQTLARSQGGLGLGLPIVRSLVEMHGGSVSVRSAGIGHGSQFTLELPAAPAPAEAVPAEGAAVARRSGQAKRILVVDDNVDAGTGLAELLKALGHVVELVHDAEAALDAAARFRPDVALVDIGLPAMDGYELARQLKRQPGPGPRLVAVTGYGLESDRERSADAGFGAHLVKPIDLQLLERLLASEPAGSA